MNVKEFRTALRQELQILNIPVGGLNGYSKELVGWRSQDRGPVWQLCVARRGLIVIVYDIGRQPVLVYPGKSFPLDASGAKAAASCIQKSVQHLVNQHLIREVMES